MDTAVKQTWTPLTGHFSPETAYVVDDYPYGFTLRCKIRYWVEFKPKHGFRFVSQTTNPRKGGTSWNKPKASTYSAFGMVMLKGDSNGYISHTGVGLYGDAAELRSWFDRFGAFIEPKARPATEAWLKIKEAYDIPPAKTVEEITEGRTIWNSDGTTGPALITFPTKTEAEKFQEALEVEISEKEGVSELG